MNPRSPIFLIAIAVVVLLLVAGGAYYLGQIQRQPTSQEEITTQTNQSPTLVNTRSPLSPTGGAPPPSYITPVAFKAVSGIAPTLVPLNDMWPEYQNRAIGLTLHYVPEWTYVEAPQQAGVTFYPPGSDPSVPSPLIAFNFAAQHPYADTPILSHATSQTRPITVGNITGRQYEDSEYAVPTQGSYIELPYQGGTLLITATKGPTINLVPQLQEMLKTVILNP